MTRVLVMSLLLSVVGCTCNSRPPRRRDAGTPVVAPAHDEFLVPSGTNAGTSVDTDAFALNVILPEGAVYPLGRQSTFSIELRTKPGSTVPRTNPGHVELRAAQVVGLTAPRFDRATAPVNHDERVLYEVPFLPMEAGEARVDAVVHATVCTGATCEERAEHLQFLITVR